jgi:hypothetical protein
METADWQAFASFVHANSSIEGELAQIEDLHRFIERTAEIATQAGFTLSTAEIKSRIQQLKREWFERTLGQ